MATSKKLSQSFGIGPAEQYMLIQNLLYLIFATISGFPISKLMDKKSKMLLAVFSVLIVVSAVLTYWRTMVERDYPVIDLDQSQSTSSAE